MTRRDLTHREKFVIGIAILLVLGYFIKNLVLPAIESKSFSSQSELIQRQKDLRKKMHQIQSEKKLQRENQEFLRVFMSSGSEEQEMSHLVSQLQILAGQASLRIMETKPLAIKSREFYKTLSVSLVMEGTLGNVAVFLHSIQTPPNQFGVEDLLIEKNPSQPSIVSCRIEVSRIWIDSVQPIN